ncbi:MAG: Helix-turn-helix domain [Pseudomonadota bacterium]|jgi:IS30 family transposase
MKIHPRSCSQLHPEDRLTIASLLQQGRGIREIARVLARPASTIS